MTLPSSGTITAAMINAELGRSATAYFNINGSAERTLAGRPSGAIYFNHFHGKSSSISETITVTIGTDSSWAGYYPFTGLGAASPNTYRGFSINWLLSYHSPGALTPFAIELDGNIPSPATFLNSVTFVEESITMTMEIDKTTTSRTSFWAPDPPYSAPGPWLNTSNGNIRHVILGGL